MLKGRFSVTIIDSVYRKNMRSFSADVTPSVKHMFLIFEIDVQQLKFMLYFDLVCASSLRQKTFYFFIAAFN